MISREQFLGASTKLIEALADSEELGLGTVPIRELTGRQRLEALEVARKRDEQGNPLSELDDALFRASVIVYGVLDAPGGKPLLEEADILTLAEQGRQVLQPLATKILNLSWVPQVHLSRSDLPTDTGKPTP